MCTTPFFVARVVVARLDRVGIGRYTYRYTRPVVTVLLDPHRVGTVCTDLYVAS